MKPVEPSEIKSIEDYELARPAFRQRLLEVKARRRVRVGAHVTLLFENHDTVLYQIQEMVRIERITEPSAIAHEIKTYNELVPGDDELTATLLLEYEDPAEREIRLTELVGLHEHVLFTVDGVGQCRAVFDERQWSGERISSVHYVRFPLGPELAGAIGSGAETQITIDHPNMFASVQLTGDQTAALAEDLSA